MEATRRKPGMLRERVLGSGEGAAVDASSLAGLYCFSAAVQLYDNVAVLGDVRLFNGVLYLSLAQLVVLVLVAALGFLRAWHPPRALAVGSAMAGAASMVIGVSPLAGSACVPCGVVGGVALALLSACWGARLARWSGDVLRIHVPVGLFAGAAISFALFANGEAAVSEAVLAVAIVASGLLWLVPRGCGSESGAEGDASRELAGSGGGGLSGAERARTAGDLPARRPQPSDSPDVPMSRFPQPYEGPKRCAGHEPLERAAAPAAPAAAAARSAQRRAQGEQLFGVPAGLLVTLAVCCLLSAFFSGTTMNPYGMQSRHIDVFMHLIATVTFFLLAVDCMLGRRVHLQVFVFAELALLLVALLLLSTGLAGGVVLPVGLVLGVRTSTWGLGWLVLAALVRAKPSRAVAVSALCILAFGSALGRSAGILLINGGIASFADLGTFGVVCITVLAVAYALMNATKFAQTAFPVGFSLGGIVQGALAPGFDPGGRWTGEGASVAGSSTVGIAGGADAGNGVGDAGGAIADGHVAVVSERASGEPDAENVAGHAPDVRDDAQGAGRPGSHLALFDDLNLTEKEREVAGTLITGVSYQYAAESLGISPSTVKYHAKHIYEKAGVVSKTEFIEKYQR